ncbi:hypothetical protein HYDPIDRAFT_32320 [Hydnomerulius pinastri MD-312]|uniref:DUF6534 domain-containing protein n=1 Tax=Hydnomerulius pinastri MD-312 TaxID=994086 RepID=A0A0C9V4F7_9AGAM|nr:hypothetical protein HYDPIDRAFT_32320 [Hydnomerulius pinastri MD-312]
MATQAGVSLGPMLVGFALNTILYGVVVTQTLVYFSCYKSDGRWIKLFVTLLFALDTVNVVFEFVYLYDTLIIHFGDQSALLTANWVFSTVPGTTVGDKHIDSYLGSLDGKQGVTSALVQLFFAWRINVLNSSRFVVVGIGVLAIVGMLSGIGASVAVNVVPTFTQFHKFESIVIVWLCASAADNILITIVLVLSLREHRTGFADTDHIIKKIIRVTLHTGLLTAIWTIVDLSVYLALTDGMHLVFVLSLAKLYTNSLLSTLISRARDSDYADFTVVNGSGQPERREDFIQLGHRAEVAPRRNSDIVFDTISVKKLEDQTSIRRGAR